MEEKIRKTIGDLNAHLQGMPYRLDLVNPREIILLEKNARYMTQEMFQNLVSNIKKDGGLSSLPLCYREKDGRLLALSGNHRVDAAVHVGLEEILILVIDKELTRQEQVAIQLSHNAIEGRDDPVILKELWDEIEVIDLKMYAGLDSELIKELERMEFTSIVEARPDFKHLMFLFLPEETEEIRKILSDVDLYFAGEENYILSRAHYEVVFNLLVEIKDQYNIINNPTAFMKIVQLARKSIDAKEA
jgi:hypothetical protein